jgi:hypothetical protein
VAEAMPPVTKASPAIGASGAGPPARGQPRPRSVLLGLPWQRTRPDARGGYLIAADPGDFTGATGTRADQD